jgi:hypothetical protein
MTECVRNGLTVRAEDIAGSFVICANETSTSTMGWRPVVGFEGLYKVSDTGLVNGLERIIPHARNVQRTIPQRRLKTDTTKGGHLRVTLHRDNTKRRRFVHHLVLEAFVGPCPPGLEACHENGDPTDNRVENLRWDTRANNHADSLRHGTKPIGSAHSNAKLTEATVAAMRAALALGASVSAVARAAGCSRVNVRRIRDGKGWTHVPALAGITDPAEALRAIYASLTEKP